MENRLKILRNNRGWTQEELSEKIGVSRQTVISLENGRYSPSLSLAFKIARTFECAIEEIFIDGNE
ncbi:helix-turn-helix transcriptional regulator [Paenibacillus sp. WQ 127069]|jgi:putative transcriptional regulator|uniref:Helix-turn-helix transcriptional regulator n=1 Tax=Paenibacillus baimaensis TaxID=2982185 RepID=A0ABT2UFK1_9BACL|nr:helix-turn-helix transcriptional regulator [Paenibacillus sp. WQ 127069]MCU6792429.1 helix-turn-helix transcriptional regulator [Paenibacillus sp. WQ 127069]